MLRLHAGDEVAGTILLQKVWIAFDRGLSLLARHLIR
jgi:hypothetical protein